MRSALPDDVAFVLPSQAYLLEDSLETNATYFDAPPTWPKNLLLYSVDLL